MKVLYYPAAYLAILKYKDGHKDFICSLSDQEEVLRRAKIAFETTKNVESVNIKKVNEHWSIVE